MKEKKLIKKDFYEAIIKAMQTGEINIDPQLVIEWAQNEIVQLDAKAEKAKARAEKKKAEGDPMMDWVRQVLTDDFAFTSDITLKVGEIAGEDADITVHKIQYRLNQLVKSGVAEATDKQVEGDKKRTLKAYRKVSE